MKWKSKITEQCLAQESFYKDLLVPRTSRPRRSLFGPVFILNNAYNMYL